MIGDGGRERRYVPKPGGMNKDKMAVDMQRMVRQIDELYGLAEELPEAEKVALQNEISNLVITQAATCCAVDKLYNERINKPTPPPEQLN